MLVLLQPVVKFSNAFNATMVDNLTFSRKSTPVSVLVTFSVIFVGKTNCSRNTIQMSGIYRINLHSCGTTFSPAIDYLCLILHNHEGRIHIFTSGGSRISHTGGSTNTDVGRQPIWQNNCRKLHETVRNWTGVHP